VKAAGKPEGTDPFPVCFCASVSEGSAASHLLEVLFGLLVHAVLL